MNITNLPGSKVQFEVEVSVETFKKALDEAYEEQAKNYEIPGFRKGHVPKEIYMAREGEKSLYPKALDLVINDTYYEVVENEKLKVVSQPDIDLDYENIKSSEPFKYTVTVEVVPQVTLGEYKGLEVEKDSIEVSDSEVQAVIDRQLREDTMESDKEESEPVEDGDKVIIDYEGSVDGELFEGGSAKEQPLVIGSHTFIPGFEEQLIGLKKGDVKDINVKFPDDYQAEHLKGKDAVFKITLHSIKRMETPEFNDDFVLGLDHEGVKTADEYRAHIKEHLGEHKEHDASEKAEKALLDKIIENAKFDVPEKLVAEEANYMFEEEAQSFEQQYKGFKFDMYLSYTGQTKESHIESLKEEAKFRFSRDFVLGAIAKAEKIDATKEELEKEYEDIAKYYSLSVDDVKARLNEERVTEQVTLRKAYEFVKENNKFVAKKEEKTE